MYLVLNVTNSVVFLADIRVEIPPRKTVDLERVVGLDNIRRSNDLKIALESKRIALAHIDKAESKTNKVEKKEDVKSIIKEILKEHNNDTKEEIKQILKDAISSLSNTGNTKKDVIKNDIDIDPEKLAKISSIGINSISSKMESSENFENNSQINIVNKNYKKIIDEL